MEVTTTPDTARQLYLASGNGRPLLLSLFSGSGGLDLGFWQAGYDVVLAADVVRAAVNTHQLNHGWHGTTSRHLDLSVTGYTELAAMWFDHATRPPVGIIGGPPCQAFSKSNVYKRDDDPRRQMPAHYADIVEGFNRSFGIDFFLFENVGALRDDEHAEVFNAFKDQCYQAGFDIYEQVVDAVRFGVPQVRERVIVVGINRNRFPSVSYAIPMGDACAPVPIDTVLRGLPEPVFNARGMTPYDVPFHPNHWTFKVKSAKFTNGAIQPGRAIGRSFRALEWGHPSWTVAYGHREVHVHPDCHRRLSIYEAMLLQGFPRSYVLDGTISEQVILVSDAVPPPVGKALATSIGAALHYQLREPEQPPDTEHEAFARLTRHLAIQAQAREPVAEPS